MSEHPKWYEHFCKAVMYLGSAGENLEEACLHEGQTQFLGLTNDIRILKLKMTSMLKKVIKQDEKEGWLKK